MDRPGLEPGPLVMGVQSVGRHVANLDRAVEFYQAIGFAHMRTDLKRWGAGDAESRLYATGAAWCRSASMTINSAATGEPFEVLLREFGGISRSDWSELETWRLGAGHIGLGVENPEDFVAGLRRIGALRALTHGGQPLEMSEDLKPPNAGRTAFVAILDPDGTAIEVQPPRAARPESSLNVAFEAQGEGFNHVNVNVLDHTAAERFYKLLNVRFPPGPREWLVDPWLDNVFGLPGDGHSWKIVNGETPEASGTETQMLVELIAFKEFPDRSHLAEMRFADVNVTSLCFEVRDVAETHARLVAAGALPWSGEVAELDDGTTAVVVRDPDVGTFIELRQRAARRETSQSSRSATEATG
jgi:catechol 2,3-dioxygenase-like lactoylglutathione lyase family enzyme